jgi:hypothetical protein
VLLAVLYLPWVVTLSGALGQWRQSQVYLMTGNVLAEQGVKLGYWFYSFTFGEAMPAWLLPITAVLAVPYLWLLISGASLRRDWLWAALTVAAVGFLGATRWVSYAAMPARLLFLLPLFVVAMAVGITAKHRTGTILGIILVAVNLVGMWTYYGATDLLNTGYLTPNQTIAAEIAQNSNPQDTVVWIDSISFDGTTIEYYLPRGFRIRWLASPESVAAARDELNAGTIRHVWLVRRSHDISPGHIFQDLDAQMMESSKESVLHPYVSPSPVHRLILRGLSRFHYSGEDRPRQYMCVVSEFREPS